jgi:CheY-like chemotaxis protein
MSETAHILVVDDDPDIREVLRLILEEAGYRVQTAVDGQDATACISSQMPSLIILDIMMSTDSEGFDLMYTLRSDPKTDNIPVIFLTSFLEKVRSTGPDSFDYIMGELWAATWIFEKPLNKEKLLEKIDAILSER